MQDDKQSQQPFRYHVADKIFILTFCVAFLSLLCGVADSAVNEFLHSRAYENAGWLSKISLRIFGPADYAQHLRGYGFLGFSIIAAIASFFLALFASLASLIIAWVFEMPKSRITHQRLLEDLS